VPFRPAATGEILVALDTRSAQLGAEVAADLVESLGGPADDVERVEADDRLGRLGAQGGVDPLGAVGRHVRDQLGPLGTEGVEERLDGGGVTTGRRPEGPPGVVVGDRRQVAVPPAVGDLVDPDPGDPIVAVGAAQRMGHHPFDPGGHRPPRHPQPPPRSSARPSRRRCPRRPE
jgi:hypothetical protein